MWLADALTLVRIPLALVFALTYGGGPAVPAIVIALAAASDLADGRVARRARRRRGIPPTAPSRGDWLDPIADKLFVVVVAATIVAHDHPPLAVVALVLARELFYLPLAALAGLGLIRRPPRRELRAAPIGKIATAAQLV